MNMMHSAWRFGIRSSFIATTIAFALLAGVLMCACQPALAQYVQQGPKLVGSNEVGTDAQGTSVAVAATNPTILVGAPYATNNYGFALVYVRSNGAWQQQGGELHPANQIGAAFFGWSVALSEDGNTAIIGGWNDNGGVGAAWVFVRSGSTWVQQSKLIATGAIGGAQLGSAVALSADGNTAIVGGFGDNSATGAAWVFTRSGGIWTQQAKLVGSATSSLSVFGYSVGISAAGNVAIVGASQYASPGAAWVFGRNNSGQWSEQARLVGDSAIGNARQGISVALSGEGDTALVGGPGDNNDVGAAWVFAHSGGVWTQQAKLIGSGAAGNAGQGSSVALPFSDTGPALVGGNNDNNGIGAAWVFFRSSGVWTQQGQKLVGSGAVSTNATTPGEGFSVALAQLNAAGHDATLAVLGGPGDTNDLGAAWVFATHGAVASHDFDGNAYSDILWRDNFGNVALWTMSGNQVSSNTLVSNVPSAWSIAGQRDFDGDTDSDILWRDTSGDVAIWLMHSGHVASSALVGSALTNWSVAGTGDFDADGKGDILWRDNAGDVAIWLMNGATVSSSIFVANVPASWSIVGASGNSVLWQDNTGNTAIWLMNGGTVASNVYLGNVPTTWSIVGSGDFNGDGNIDILWRDNTGNVAVWLLDATGHVTSNLFVANVSTTWSIAETGDFNGDGKSDILWHDSSGNTAIWLMYGGTVSANLFVANVSTAWSIQGASGD